MYDLVEDDNALYLVKKRPEDNHFNVVATFNGEPHEVRDTAIQMVAVLNERLG